MLFSISQLAETELAIANRSDPDQQQQLPQSNDSNISDKPSQFSQYDIVGSTASGSADTGAQELLLLKARLQQQQQHADAIQVCGTCRNMFV
jgi:hypothetical protein